MHRAREYALAFSPKLIVRCCRATAARSKCSWAKPRARIRIFLGQTLIRYAEWFRNIHYLHDHIVLYALMGRRLRTKLYRLSEALVWHSFGGEQKLGLRERVGESSTRERTGFIKRVHGPNSQFLILYQVEPCISCLGIGVGS